MKHLYSCASVYNRIFPVDVDDLELFAQSAAASCILLDLGAGSSSFAEQLEAFLRRPPTTDRRPPFRLIAFDPDPVALRSNPARVRVVGDAWALPFADAAFGGIVSRLFGVAYALGAAWQEPARWPRLAPEIARVLAPRGMAMLEVPLAWRPEKLQGMEETVGGRRSAVGGEVAGDLGSSKDVCSPTTDCRPTTDDHSSTDDRRLTTDDGRFTADRVSYSFRYLDVLARTPWGAVLDSMIEVEGPVVGRQSSVVGEAGFDDPERALPAHAAQQSPTTDDRLPTTAFLHAPLHVFTPGGAREWAAGAGMELLGFFASYDAGSLTQEPPGDCLRGVIWLKRLAP